MRNLANLLCLIVLLLALFFTAAGFGAKLDAKWQSSSISFSHATICYLVFIVLRWLSGVGFDSKK